MSVFLLYITFFVEIVFYPKFSELFTIINSRLLNPQTKTIISTNLSLENLAKNYDDRILSRLIGNFNICKFFGEDLRLKR